ncbi:YdeI/OmpD-associated family protein [bacterium]|nr:YdeI/OmpD-associated family protein [bacterium]
MHEFETTIVRLPGKMAWPVFYIPTSFTDTTGTRGRINVLATVDGAEFRATLLPSSNVHYLVYNKAMREHCGKKIGDTVHVLLEIDDQPRELELSDDVADALAASETAVKKFAALPYYIRREEINKINSAKMQPTREKRIKALVEKFSK